VRAEGDFQWGNGDIDWDIVNEDGVALLIYRPADPVSGDWPAGQFPLVFHHHGNGGQDGALYEHLAEAVVDDGAIFVSVADKHAANPDFRAMVNICMLRWLFTADDWDGDGPGAGGASKLDGNVVVMGHSNGGEGAHIVNKWLGERPWVDDVEAPEHGMRLCGVIGLAPRGAESKHSPFSSSGVRVSGAVTVPYLTIEGSLDNDVPGGSLWNSSHSGLDELHTPRDAAKITVWVYDAEHDSFGGGGIIRVGDARSTVQGLPLAVQLDRGEFVAATWSDAFVRRFAFGDISAEPLLYGRELPLALQTPTWWDYHPAYVGEPLLFVGSEPHQSAAAAEFGVRRVVDTMLRGDSLVCSETQVDNGPSTTSEGTPFSAANWPPGALRTNCAWNLAAYGSKNAGRYETFVLRADYTAPPNELDDPAERTLTWGLDTLGLEDAVAFSFRATTIDEVDYPGQGLGCSPAAGNPADETDFQVVFVSTGDVEVSVSVSTTRGWSFPTSSRSSVPRIMPLVYARSRISCRRSGCPSMKCCATRSRPQSSERCGLCSTGSPSPRGMRCCSTPSSFTAIPRRHPCAAEPRAGLVQGGQASDLLCQDR